MKLLHFFFSAIAYPRIIAQPNVIQKWVFVKVVFLEYRREAVSCQTETRQLRESVECVIVYGRQTANGSALI